MTRPLTARRRDAQNDLRARGRRLDGVRTKYLVLLRLRSANTRIRR